MFLETNQIILEAHKLPNVNQLISAKINDLMKEILNHLSPLKKTKDSEPGFRISPTAKHVFQFAINCIEVHSSYQNDRVVSKDGRNYLDGNSIKSCFDG